MQRSVPAAAVPKRETQPIVFIRPKPRLMVLYASGTSGDVVRYLERLAASTHLAPQRIQVDRMRRDATARETVARLTRDSDVAPHLLLCIHGAVAPRSGRGLRRGRHAVGITSGDEGAVATKRVFQWIMRDLAARRPRTSAGGTLPFVHLLSCHAGLLRKQLAPGSALWRSAYFLLYSGKRSTSLSACGNAMTTAVRYIDWCEQQGCAVDPLKLLYLAGLRRGECLTLMGGDLSAPLVWHAPKSEADLSDQHSIATMEGDPQDITRLHASARMLGPDELSLLPAASLRELMANRLERDDVATVSALLTAHPELRDTPCALGAPPLTEAVEKKAQRCLAELLARGADPNDLRGDITPLQMCVAALDHNLQALSALLAHGADPNLADSEGYTPLMLAVDAEWEAGVRLLLAHGARIDRRADGLTCFEAAALDGKARAVAWLLAAGAGEAEGLTPDLIQQTLAQGHTELAASLVAARVRRLNAAGDTHA